MKPPTHKKTPFASIWIYNPPHLPGEAKRRGSWPVLGHPLIPRAPSCTLRSPASLRNLVATTSGGGISEGSLRWRWWRFFEIWEVVGWTLISRVLGFNVIWCFFCIFDPYFGKDSNLWLYFSDGLTPPNRWKQVVLVELVTWWWHKVLFIIPTSASRWVVCQHRFILESIPRWSPYRTNHLPLEARPVASQGIFVSRYTDVFYKLAVAQSKAATLE